MVVSGESILFFLSSNLERQQPLMKLQPVSQNDQLDIVHAAWHLRLQNHEHLNVRPTALHRRAAAHMPSPTQLASTLHCNVPLHFVGPQVGKLKRAKYYPPL